MHSVNGLLHKQLLMSEKRAKEAGREPLVSTKAFDFDLSVAAPPQGVGLQFLFPQEGL